MRILKNCLQKIYKGLFHYWRRSVRFLLEKSSTIDLVFELVHRAYLETKTRYIGTQGV